MPILFLYEVNESALVVRLYEGNESALVVRLGC